MKVTYIDHQGRIRGADFLARLGRHLTDEVLQRSTGAVGLTGLDRSQRASQFGQQAAFDSTRKIEIGDEVLQGGDFFARRRGCSGSVCMERTGTSRSRVSMSPPFVVLSDVGAKVN